MPLIRTDRGLQWFADPPPPELLLGAPHKPEQRAFNLRGLGKMLLPFLPLLFSLVSWLLVKYSTSDRMQQQQQDDHVALIQVKEQLGQLKTETSTLGAKVDLLLRINLKENSK